MRFDIRNTDALHAVRLLWDLPYPTDIATLLTVGTLYYAQRQSITEARHEGLTKVYNRFHDRDDHSPDTVRLRELHTELDRAVTAAYGWIDLDLGHGFHDTKQGCAS